MVAITHGSGRTVVLLPRLGIVLKFPRPVQPIGSSKGRFSHLKERGVEFVESLYWSFRDMLFGALTHRAPDWRGVSFRWEDLQNSLGLAGLYFVQDNLSERRFYRQSSGLARLVLVPTYFSLFGLVNVQRFVQPMSHKGKEALEAKDRLSIIIGVRNYARDGHTFGSMRNFSLGVAGIQCLDYALPQTQDILTTYAEAILRDFEKFTPLEVASIKEKQLKEWEEERFKEISEEFSSEL